MANPVWTGTLSFGLVSLAVRLFPARERHGPTRHQFVKGTSDRVRYKRIDERTGREIPQEDIVTGVEYGGRDRYVILDPAEVEAIQPVRSRSLEIERFVPTTHIDPLRYDSTYYAEPDKGGSRPYALLHRALTRTGRAALGRMILRERERLVLITPQQGVLTVSTLYWPDEIREPEDVMRPPAEEETDEQQLDLALQLVDAMAITWEPDAYQDEYQRRLEELIEAKAQGSTISYGPKEPQPRGTVVDLDQALRASVAQRNEERRARDAGRTAALRGPGTGTKKELMARAKELSIEGRSKMTRDELAKAVEQAQAS